MVSSKQIVLLIALLLCGSPVFAEPEAGEPMPMLRGLTPSGSEQIAAPSAASPLPGSSDSAPKLQQNTSLTESVAGQPGTVESFFQIDPGQRNSPASLARQPLTREIERPEHHSPLYWSYRGLWHVLDNLGVPVPQVGETYLDPSIKKVYSIPCPKLPAENSIVREVKAATAPVKPLPVQSLPANAQPAMHKIPQSQFEGVELPTPRDQGHALTP